MNIIKLKDIIKENDAYFNEHLKGKYAFWVHMRYIVSFDHMDASQYIMCEEDINKLLYPNKNDCPYFEAPYIDVYECDILPYIDTVATDEANNMYQFILKNNYSPDADITLDELKKFRTWLATQLLKFDQNNEGVQQYKIFDDDTTHMLQYYANNMYNEVISILTSFGQYNVNYIQTNPHQCGCVNIGNLSSLYNNSLTVCDPISIYRENVYNKMVQVFSNVDFWAQWPVEFLGEFKLYIDNIIKTNLKLYKSKYTSNFVDCGCLTNDNESQEVNQAILKRLSESLSYIINDDINGHKNYIASAFMDWSKYLYELMEWV